MKKFALFALAASTLAAPLLAQSYEDQRRWDDAQARYQREVDLYQQERDRFYQARDRDRDRDRGGDRFGTSYDASKDYRNGPQYSERALGPNDQVYRGSDGRYYCKRSDGTTGLIVGAAAGGILGNVIDGGRSRIGGTLIGGALGALLGRSIDQNGTIAGGQQVHCK